ncbi:hypothetical protein GJ700_11215 [Duganella sp. FT92W]|uniref:Uncharacterized protein n=1 Tax=Pseudoduganella rivuli TaxID=2666085 RepID=A0A7X2LTX4_9BURK|nr:hypothetical protein [Pseudoduganella rivuli]MRV72284.1 hypothetical protein [Pseudoduganella rivuli]
MTTPFQPTPAEAPGAPPSIASVTIDASAEPMQAPSANVTAQDEAEFYRRSSATFQLEHNRQNLGVLGRFFGANSAASTNIAGAVVGVSLIGVFVTLFFPGNAELAETRKGLLGLITAALSFIFGAASKK